VGRVMHFEFPIDDPERAVRFYREVFGWQIEKWEGPVDYWLCKTGAEGEPGIDGALTLRSGGMKTVACIIDVDDLETSLARAEANGGKVIHRDTVPGVGIMAYCLDSEGTIIGLMQSDPEAGM